MQRAPRWSILASFLLTTGVVLSAPALSRGWSLRLDEAHLASAALVTDARGHWLAWRGPVYRRPLSPRDIPNFLKAAVVATEDSTFYRNPGVNASGMLRALVHDLARGAVVEGGSGITQQLARALYLDGRRSLGRKLEEAVLALRLTRRYTKDEILALYLSSVYFGHGAYGAEAAAETYFGRRLTELDEGELALLAGLPQAPSRYDPLLRPAEALARRRHVLRRLVRLGYLSPGRAAALAARPPRLACTLWRQGEAPQVADAALAELSRVAPEVERLLRRGEPFTVRTTIEPEAERRLREALARLGGAEKAGIVMDPVSGAIVALVGGGAAGEFNRALAAERPIASLAKPVVYAAALASRRYTLATPLEDRPLRLPGRGRPYEPQNYGGGHAGTLTLRQALATSNNVVAVAVLNELGLRRVTELAGRLGLLPFGSDLTAALGTAAHAPVSVAAAYSAFANYGLRPTPYLVAEVRAQDGTVVYRASPKTVRALGPAEAYLVTQALRSTAESGTAAGLGLRPLAVKTGTGEGRRDVWMVAMTPRRVAVLWAGKAAGFPAAAAATLGPSVAHLYRTGALLGPVVWPRPGGIAVVGGEEYLSGTQPRESAGGTTPAGARLDAQGQVAGRGRSQEAQPNGKTRELLRRWLHRFRPSGGLGHLACRPRAWAEEP